jgi:hypothetical protein
MGESMSGAGGVFVQRLRVWTARVHQLVGWAGMAGVALALVAACLAGAGWSNHRSSLDSAASRMAVMELTADPATVRIASTAERVPTSRELARRADIPLLLTQMQQAARSNGLLWPAADYRIVAATPTQPSSLEVHFAIKGSYPKLRAMLVQLMSDVPAFAIRQFSLSRPNSDTSDVEAKLVLAVFLTDEGASGDSAQPKVAQ